MIDGHLRPAGTRGIRGPKCVSHPFAAVEHGDVDARLEHRIGEALGRRQLFDLEVTPAEQEPGQPQEAGIAARHEDAGARLVAAAVVRHGAAVDARVGGAPRGPGHAVADLQTASSTLARRKLDDLARATGGDRAPGPDLVLDLDDDLVGVEEDRVDRKAHERGMDAPARPQHHALALPEILATEQPSHAAMCTVGHDDALADDPTVFPAERQCRHGAS